MKKFNKETALKLYAAGNLSLSEAADIAEMSVGEFMELSAKKGIRQEIPRELLKEAIKNAINSGIKEIEEGKIKTKDFAEIKKKYGL